jgi:NitT/TauT family transport system ATP-binding protein
VLSDRVVVMSPRPGRITDVIDGRRPRAGSGPAGRGVDGALPDGALPDSALPDSALPDSVLADEVVDDVRESAEFFAAVTEVREALRKGSA